MECTQEVALLLIKKGKVRRECPIRHRSSKKELIQMAFQVKCAWFIYSESDFVKFVLWIVVPSVLPFCVHSVAVYLF